MDFSLIPVVAPPKSSNDALNLFAQSHRQLETVHGVSQNCLYHCLDKDFTASLGQDFFFPSLYLTPYTDLRKASYLGLPNERREAQILFVLLNTGNPQYIFQLFLHVLGCVPTEEQCGLGSV